MRIYLANPPFFPGYVRGVRGVGESSRGGTLYYPIWLSYCAALLEERHDIKLVDAQARKWNIDEFITDIVEFKPKIIVIESNFSSLHQDIITVERIKNQLSVTTILVGPPTSQYSNEVIKNNAIDFVIPYEYDFILKNLVNAIEIQSDLSLVEGIIFKKDNQIIITKNREFSTSEELDSIPYVSKIYKKHLNIYDYFLSSSLFPMVQIFTGRGCPNQCTFCSWPITLMGRKYRSRSVKNVIDELEWIQNNLPIKEVFFEDDTFTINKKRVLEFCSEYKKRGLAIAWACNARANTTDFEMMKEMKRSNCRLLIVGYESGNDNLLQTIKKGITVEQSRSFAKNARKAGLLIHGDFIIGLPGETKETIHKTIEFINELRPELLQVLIPQPIPGTELYKNYIENDALITQDPSKYLDQDGYQKPVVSYPHLTAHEMNITVNNILRDYYCSFSYIPLIARQIFRKNAIFELKRVLYSTIMFIRFFNEQR